MKRKRLFSKYVFISIDFFIIFLSFSIIFLLLPKENGINTYGIITLIPHVLILLVSIEAIQYLLKTYDNMWKYAECKEYVTLFMGVILGFGLYYGINLYILPYKTTVLFLLSACSISNVLMFLLRLIYIKIQKNDLINVNKVKSIVIVGAGSAGVRIMEEMKYHPGSEFQITCFVDDSKDKIGKKLRGIPILGPIENFRDIVKDLPVNEVLLAIPSLEEERKENILKILSETNIPVKVVPDLLSILHAEEPSLLSLARSISIDDLLGRETISFDRKEIDQFLQDKVVMVTGGGGSIGSELCRQIIKSNPSLLIIVDNYENNAYEIQQELTSQYTGELKLVVEIASVQDKEKIDFLFKHYRPQIIFHAAAHKHVPFMEDCPEEAVKNNVFGTYHVVCAAAQWGAEKFVLISTDKAVNPTSIMGATKRVCEMMIQSRKGISKTEYVAVRFGNVLGSNGSVIPLFQRQIAQGGPVTITDKRAYRYFMTIPEAAQLVLRAGSMASPSEIYVLDMGKPLNILTLAEKLIRLMGYIPYEQIPIIEIGIRPGEKLYEELLMQEEELLKTENQKIFIERQKTIQPEEIEEKLAILREALNEKEKASIKIALEKIVPTFHESDIEKQ